MCCLFSVSRQPDSDETIVTTTSYNESFESESTVKTESVATATHTNAVSAYSGSIANKGKIRCKIVTCILLLE